MSQENLEIAQRVLDTYNGGDLQGSLDHLGPECEFRPSGSFMDTQRVYRGPQGWIEFWHTFREAWDSITITPERIEDLGEQVLVLGTFHGRGLGSGVGVTRESAWLLTAHDGLIVQIRAFANWDEALAAAGLSEADSFERD